MVARRREEGMALLLVLLFLALLSALIVEYIYEIRVDAALVSNHMEQMEAGLAAQSAVAMGLFLIEQDASNTDGESGTEFDAFTDAWADGVSFQQTEQGVYRCTIDDEYGKLNLNALFKTSSTGDKSKDGESSASGDVKRKASTEESSEQTDSGEESKATATQEPNEQVVETLRALLIARGVEQDPLDAILDWIDTDDDVRENGAEQADYDAASVPILCKNGAMESVEELLLIPGITTAIFFGDPDNDEVPLTELLTVNGDSKGRINVNTAEPELLDALGEVLGRSGLANIVVRQREDSVFQTTDELESRGVLEASSSGEGEASTPFIVAGGVFRIYGDGMSGDSKVRIETYVQRGSGQEAATLKLINWRVFQ